MFKLLCLSPKGLDGVSWYRLIQFFRASKEIDADFIKPNFPLNLLIEIFEKADAYINHILGAGMLEMFDIFKKNKQKNKPLIIDIDDNYELVNPLSDMYLYYGIKEIILPDGRALWKNGVAGFDIERNKKTLEKLNEILKEADLITTTTFKMREWLLQFNKKVAVIPNCIDKKYFPYIEHKKDNIVRIVWAGGSSHFADLMTILPSIKKIMEKYPNVHYYQLGQWFGVIEKYIPKNRLFYYPWISVDGHGYRMATLNLDIGLCPLTDDEFNLYKSSIKFYEYSALKIATLAKDMLPYNEDIIDGENGLLYKNAKEFEEKLEFLILNPVKRMVMAENAYEYVYEYRDLEKISKDWATMINELIKTFNTKYDKMSDLKKVADFTNLMKKV